MTLSVAVGAILVIEVLVEDRVDLARGRGKGRVRGRGRGRVRGRGRGRVRVGVRVKVRVGED